MIKAHMQKWKKLGRVFETVSNGSWKVTHAAVPTVELLSGDIYRVYFGTRNHENQASISFFDYNLKTFKVVHEASFPVLTPGKLGTFDDSGVLPSWILTVDGRKYLYYIGWNLGVTVPFRNFTGLAIQEKGSEIFRRVSEAPVADRDQHDPYFFTNACVKVEKGIWKMWYLSSVGWDGESGNAIPKYHLKYDESLDGVKWSRNPTVAIDFEHPGEHAISRPCVLKNQETYQMWYSYRSSPNGKTYRIGYAESTDGKNWKRLDESVGLSVSKEGWDSEMIEYPFVLDHGGQRFMFYNGNGYGKTGIGLAVLE